MKLAYNKKSKPIQTGKPKILGFMHIATMNHWEDIVEELMYFIIKDGLLDKTRFLTQILIGPEHKKLINKSFKKNAKKIKRFSSGFDLKKYEYPTLNSLWQTCMATDDEIYVYYCHTKGASYQQNLKSDVWRRVMAEAILEKGWRDCVKQLDAGANTCGIMRNNRHYAGNFWWAKASYIRTLKKPLRSSNRFIHETWLDIDNSSSCPEGNYPKSSRAIMNHWYNIHNLKMLKLADL